ncbi:MAG TPA: LLM class flavin-dependent oxidoreductase [Thermomicrobiales bacterium]|nr:LLM class flavin-dependent oxidoreductase [Thermomicrobiales bacterium]
MRSDDRSGRAMPETAGRWPASRRPMGLGLMVPIGEGSAFGGAPRFADMAAMARLAEAVGFDAVWFADHLAMQSADEPEPRGIWECWTMMAGVAAVTERIQIGSLVACAGFRNAGVIAKMTEAIDEISGGRFILGLGAGWHKPEYDMFGFPFDHRVSRFEDALRVIQPMLRQGVATYDGTYAQAADAINQPRGPRPDGAPILVGSDGARMLRLIAQYADAWNTVWHRDPAALPPLLAAVDAACAEVGRDPATLVRTAGGNIAMPGYLGVRPDPIEGDADGIAGTLAAFRDLGLRHYVCGIDPCTPTSIEQFGRVIELLDGRRG